MKTLSALLSAAILLLIAPLATAQDFTVVQREVDVDSNDLYEILGDAYYDQSPVDVARTLMAMSASELMAMLGDAAGMSTTTIYLKGSRIRVGYGDSYALMNAETGLVQMVQGPQRTYMEWSQADVDALGDMGMDAEDYDEEWDEYAGEEDEWVDEDGNDLGEAIGSGVSATINGLPATSHETAGWEAITVTWCSEAYASLRSAFEQMMQNAIFSEEEDADEAGRECESGFMVREQTYFPMDMRYSMEEVVSVTESELSDDLFRVPEGFTKAKSPF